MENFLNKEDYEFYKKSMRTTIVAGKTILTNNGFYADEPDIDTRKKITHMSINRDVKKLKEYKFNDYSNLRYLNYALEIENINLEKFNNLNILQILISDIASKKLLNLPNIETLIFSKTIELH